MTTTEVVLLDDHQAVLTGVDLPVVPPARIYVSGHMYRIAAPRAVLPPLANTVKFILNWAGPAGRVAKNILYGLKSTGSGSGSTSDPASLSTWADQLMNTWVTGNLANSYVSSWSLQSVTARDNGGTSAVGLSTHAAIPGLAGASPFPPQVAVCISWQVADSYRGGKPRTYLPGIPTSATGTAGDSQLTPGYASGVDNEASLFLSSFNAVTSSAGTMTLGSVSHFSGHSVRPVPQFRAYLGVRVHERLDSQRRRSGRESSFPTTA